MNTKKIYDAQLNVSKFYNEETINDLVSKLSFIGDKTYYNEYSKSIDIEINRMANVNDDYTIKEIIKEWLNYIASENSNIKNDIDIIINNIDYVFNILKIGYRDIERHVIRINLY